METLKEKVAEIEKDEISRALRECHGVMAQAAKRLGITERMIGYKIRKYGIRKGGGAEGGAQSLGSTEHAVPEQTGIACNQNS